MSNNKKRGQITFFVLLALMILVIAVFLSFIKGKVVKKEVQTEVKVTQRLPENIRAVEAFVTSCLDDIAKDALELAGKQGGKIYNLNTGRSLGHGRSVNLASTTDGVTHIQKKAVPSALTESYFIEYILTDETIKGANRPNHRFLPNLRKEPGVPEINTIEFQLEHYTTSRFKAGCTDLSEFEKKGLEIKKIKDPEVDVVIGSEDVIFNLDYPIQIKDKKTNDKSDLSKFSAVEKVRLEKIYNYLELYFKIIVDEWNSPTPNIYNKIKGLNADPRATSDKRFDKDIEGFETYEDKTETGKDAFGFLIVIRDKLSNLRDKKYEFWLMRRPLEFTLISNKLRESIKTGGNLNKEFNFPVDIENLGYICIADSVKGIPLFNKKGFGTILDNINPAENNMFFITANKNRLLYSTKLTDEKNQGIRIGPVPFACYKKTNDKIIIKGDIEKKPDITKIKFHGYPLTGSKPIGEIKFGESDRGAEYFFEGLKLTIPKNDNVQNIKLEYDYEKDPDLSKTSQAGRIIWDSYLILALPDDHCGNSILTIPQLIVTSKSSPVPGCTPGIPDKDDITIHLLGDCNKDPPKVTPNGICRPAGVGKIDIEIKNVKADCNNANYQITFDLKDHRSKCVGTGLAQYDIEKT